DGARVVLPFTNGVDRNRKRQGCTLHRARESDIVYARGVAVAERPNEEPVGDAEDGGAGADAQRNGDKCDEGPAGRTAKRPECEGRVRRDFGRGLRCPHGGLTYSL